METLFTNPYPEICEFVQDTKSLSLDGLHPIEISTGNTFLSSGRRSEYFSGRRCAHAALKLEGYPLLPIIRALDRSPVWPLNTLGSISHGASIAAALVKKRFNWETLGIGLDIEDLSREINTDISRTTLTDWERHHWSVQSVQTSQEARIIFSIKETIYKCFYPVHNIYLGFHDAEITEMDANSFKARLLKNPFKKPVTLPIDLNGKLQVVNQVVLSAMTISIDQFA